MSDRDVVIIGGGPAGYVAAVRASQLGARVALVERERLGGACINRACIPTKFLLHVVDSYRSLKNAGQYGLEFTGVNIDLVRVQSAKNTVIARLVDSLQGLMEENRVEVISGSARLASEHTIVIDRGPGVTDTLTAPKIILATGSTPVKLPIPGTDATDILQSWGILGLERLPKSLVMIGGGVVGVEMASILGGLGCRVSIVEILPHILPTEDAEIAAILERSLKRFGVQTYAGTRVTAVESTAEGKRINLSAGGVEKVLEAEAVAIAVGQKAYTEGLGLAECGVTVERGRILTDPRQETANKGIYAAGDVTSHLMLAYVAMAEGKAAAENALGGNSRVDYEAVPRCIFSLPEMAAVGLSEEEAKKRGYQVKCGRFPFSANSMATILGERRGMVKIVAEAGSGRVLGVHIIGLEAVNLIAEATVAMRLGATVKDIKDTIHAHPTLSEAIWNAALDVNGEAIDFKSGLPGQQGV
jgi:dihydrolipoamide dehydrogenase